jgi:hypothetical protein
MCCQTPLALGVELWPPLSDYSTCEKQKDYSDILLTIQIYNKEKIMDVNTSIKQPRLEDSKKKN